MDDITIENIEIPSNFKKIIIKLYPEINDIECSTIMQNIIYNPSTFNPIKHFMIGIKIFINQNDVPKGNKEYYKDLLTELFMATYGGEMNFISFSIDSIIVPPSKTNEEKFLEIFGKK